MRFVRSGYFNLYITTGTFRESGSCSYQWSGRSGALVSAAFYMLIEGSKNVWTSETYNGQNARWFGYPLRCLSIVIDI